MQGSSGNLTARKTIFSFSNRPEKMVFPKKSRKIFIIWSLSYCWERSCFFFSKIWSYTLDGKWKMIFLKKIRGNMIFSSNFLKRWSFQKGPRRDMILLALSGKMLFFPQNTIFSLWAGSQRWPFSRNTWKYDVFCVHVGCYKRGVTPLCQKKIEDVLIPQKYT